MQEKANDYLLSQIINLAQEIKKWEDKSPHGATTQEQLDSVANHKKERLKMFNYIKMRINEQN